jgi:hypothetical protein
MDKMAKATEPLVTTSLIFSPLQAAKKQDIVYLGRGSVTNALPVFGVCSLPK